MISGDHDSNLRVHGRRSRGRVSFTISGFFVMVFFCQDLVVSGLSNDLFFSSSLWTQTIGSPLSIRKGSCC